MMRTLLIASVIAITSALASAQQWVDVAGVSVFNQTSTVQQTTLLTPTQPGLYRVTFYVSGHPGSGVVPEGSYHEVITATDITGESSNVDVMTHCNGQPNPSSGTFVIALQPNMPMTYAVSSVGSVSGCTYNLSVVVEQYQ